MVTHSNEGALGMVPPMRSALIVLSLLISSSAWAQSTIAPKLDADPKKPNFGPRPEHMPLSESGTGLAAEASPPPPLVLVPTTPTPKHDEQKVLQFGFYVQPQLLTVVTNDAASLNAGNAGSVPQGLRNVGGSGSLPPGVSANDVTARPDGSTTNTTFFRMRRTRFRATFDPTSYARAYLEIDATPIGTGTTFVRQALGTGIARWSSDVTTEFTAGIARLPVTLELIESSRERPFVERSIGVRVFWPGESDIGAFVHTTGFNKKLRVGTGVVNGSTLGYPTFAQVPDLDRGKDVFVTGLYNAGAVTALVSAYGGTGQIISGNVFRTFPHYVFNVGASLKKTLSVGETRISGELKVAHNMDRGFVYSFAPPQFPAGDPTGPLTSRNGLAFYLRAEQEVTKHALVGIRYDSYTPNVKLSKSSYRSLGVVAAARFGSSMSLGVEYQYAHDTVHDVNVLPVARVFHVLSSVFQVRYDP